jgi:hypothetical protein
MLRVVIYINQTPIRELGAVRVKPYNAREGQMCTYQMDGEIKEIKNRFDWDKGAIKLAIKMLKRCL